MLKENCKRCKWVPEDDLLYQEYHDHEWGIPLHDDMRLFEMINLEGAQAGLSWITILRRRDSYRKAFANFDAGKLLKFTSAKKDKLLQNESIIRNRLKIAGVFKNAEAYIKVQKEFGSFDKYLWHFTDRKVIVRPTKKKGEEMSTIMSKDLKKRGFTFVGPTICYAFMQAIGIVNDHDKRCFKYLR